MNQWVMSRAACWRAARTRLAGPGVVPAVLLACLLAPLNATMVVVALPQVTSEFGVPAGASSLVVTAYLITMAVLPPLGGRLGDLWSRRTLLLAGLALFGLAALGASTARGLYLLLAWRVLQAVGGAMVFPNALALLRERVLAHLRGLSFGLVGTVVALSASVGPPLGQVLLAHGGWRAVFWVNVPLVALAIGVSAVTLNRATTAVPAGRHPPAGDSVAVLLVLRNRRFVAATSAMALSNIAMYTALVGLPLGLAASREGSKGGLLLVALMGPAALVAPVGGRFADLHGRRAVAVAGLCMLAAGMLCLSIIGQELGEPLMVAGLALSGVGLGASSTAIQTAGIEAVGANESGTAAGFLSTSRYLGGAAGSGLTPLALWAAPLAPMSVVFALAAGAALVSALVAAQMGATSALQRETGRALR